MVLLRAMASYTVAPNEGRAGEMHCNVMSCRTISFGVRRAGKTAFDGVAESVVVLVAEFLLWLDRLIPVKLWVVVG